MWSRHRVRDRSSNSYCQTVNSHRSFSWLINPTDQVEQSTFTTSTMSQEHNKFSWLKFEANVLRTVASLLPGKLCTGFQSAQRLPPQNRQPASWLLTLESWTREQICPPLLYWHVWFQLNSTNLREETLYLVVILFKTRRCRNSVDIASDWYPKLSDW